VIAAAIRQQAHQEQLTSQPVISAAILQPTDQEATTHLQFPPPSFNRQIKNNSPAIPTAILQPPDQEQATHQRFPPPSFNRQIKSKQLAHQQFTPPSLSTSTSKQAHPEQLTSDSRHPSTARSRTIRHPSTSTSDPEQLISQ
jgi:hypothetical protein